jgi:TRAP-type uncharacterized transport system substrate-binding protein
MRSSKSSPERAFAAVKHNGYWYYIDQTDITLELKNSAGSAENLKLLEAASGGVDIAFVQGSLRTLVPDTELVSLGSLFFEPLWIFYRKDLSLQRIPNLKGLRLAVGREGSGSKVLALRLLELNGLNSTNIRIIHYGYQKAADMLQSGEVDAAFFVSTHRASFVMDLIDSKFFKLMGI